MMKHYFTLVPAICFWLMTLSAPFVFGREEHPQMHNQRYTTTSFEYGLFDGNNISCWLSNDGLIVTWRKTGHSGMEWPKGSGKTIDYCSGLWIIGKSPDGDVRTACAQYSSEFQPGIILSNGAPDDPSRPLYRIYKINSDGTGDWDDWPFDIGAPALKAKDGSDSLDANGLKIPRLVGDQTIWWVMNDGDEATHNNIFETKPLGIEVHVLIYGYNHEPLSDVLFIEWTIKNKSAIDYDSLYVSLFDDADVGDASDDAAGCDPALSLGYFYNARIVDATYDAPVPALGFTLLQGANNGTLASPNYLPMTGFSYFWGGAADPYGDPNNAMEAYHFVKGQAADGSFWRTPEGYETVFPLDGDPYTGEGWIHEGSGDRRGLVSSGPFSLPAGCEQQICGAKVIAQGVNHLHSVYELKRLSRWLHTFYAIKRGDQMRATPIVHMQVVQTKKVPELIWNDVLEQYANTDLHLLGYVLYQLQGGEKLEIARFDRVDGITEIKDLVDGLEQVVYYGEENGLQTTTTVEQDFYTGQPFEYAREYQYALQAYVYDESAEAGAKVLSNDLEPVHYMHLPENYQARHDARHVAGEGEGSVTMTIYDPSLLNEHRYRMSIEQGALPMLTIQDFTTGDIIESFPNDNISFQINMDTVGLVLDIVNDVRIKELQVTGEPWLLGLDERLMIGFLGWLDPEILHFNHLPAISIEFQDAASVANEGYWSKGIIWSWVDETISIGQLPLAAYDITKPDEKRRLNVGFIEERATLVPNGIWDLGWDGSQYQGYNGGYERLAILFTDYDEGRMYKNASEAEETICYYYIPQVADSLPYLGKKFSLEIQPSRGLQPGDIFDVVAGILDVKEKTPVVATDILLQNYPNPFNAYTTIRYEIGKTAHVKMSVFNVRGQKVGTLVDDLREPGAYELSWNAAQMSTGVYFIRLVAGEERSFVKKALIIK